MEAGVPVRAGRGGARLALLRPPGHDRQVSMAWFRDKCWHDIRRSDLGVADKCVLFNMHIFAYFVSHALKILAFRLHLSCFGVLQ